MPPLDQQRTSTLGNTTRMDISTTTTLNNGTEMPVVGLGTYLSDDGEEVQHAVQWALEAGYRAIDTASMYKNEEGIGAAVAASPIPREEIFITSKVWNSDQGYESALASCERSLERLGTDYLDLLLIHWPSRSHMADTWRAFEELVADGKVRAIGVSNFLGHHLDELLSFATIAPAVNQFEHHPYLQQPELVAKCESHDIKVTAWAPILKGRVNDIDTISSIAAEVGATPAQVTLRWMIERGVIVIPKSVRQERIAENSQLFEFALSDGHMAQLSALDRDERVGPHPDEFPGT